MSCEQELSRMREINLQLRRQLERARRDALLYAASFCEESGGHVYAKKLREIAGE